jgi:hypothetical protein
MLESEIKVANMVAVFFYCEAPLPWFAKGNLLHMGNKKKL